MSIEELLFWWHTFNMAAIKRVRIEVKGKNEFFWTTFIVAFKASRLGLSVYDVDHKSFSHSTFFVEGDQKKLWQFIGSLKRPPIFITLDELDFKFL